MLRLIPSSFMYFISGIFVAISVNLVTSNISNIVSGLSGITLIALSLPWLIIAILVAGIAVNLEQLETEYQVSTKSSLNAEECAELRKAIYTTKAFKIRALAVLAVLVLVIGTMHTTLVIKDEQKYNQSTHLENCRNDDK